MKNIATIVNFARYLEPREYNPDMFGTTKKQYDAIVQAGLSATFLLQYDTYIHEEYVHLFRSAPDYIEVGLWLEIPRPLVEDAGVTWRGEDVGWHWSCHCDMTMGYTRTEKKAIIDQAFKVFKETFGYYPKSVGSWMLDAEALDYMQQTYGVDASCICKEQWGTDGYSLFGGYYDQAYYPCKKNILCPAQSAEEQIDVPMFRMLGSDPIYQYDCHIWSTKGHVYTLEPAKIPNLNAGGSDKNWVDWYFKNRFESGCSFGYAQIGQENFFPWEQIEDGFLYQIQRIKALQEAGEVDVITLRDAGRWIKGKYQKSPVCSFAALDDWMDEGRKSVWYNCKNYRMNVFACKEHVKIRDIHMFDERYPARYNDDNVVNGNAALMDTLPVMNGLTWSDNDTLAGVYFTNGNGEKIKPVDFQYEENENACRILITGDGGEKFIITATECGISVKVKNGVVGAKIELVSLLSDENAKIENGHTVSLTKRGFPYQVWLEKGLFDGRNIRFEDGEAALKFINSEKNKR